jgi:hypothetical protein
MVTHLPSPLDAVSPIWREYRSMSSGSKPNIRFILTVSVLALVALLAIGLILVGYAVATQHAIGIFAPFGNAVNVKTK